jgi:hypothetical protein
MLQTSHRLTSSATNSNQTTIPFKLFSDIPPHAGEKPKKMKNQTFLNNVSVIEANLEGGQCDLIGAKTSNANLVLVNLG